MEKIHIFADSACDIPQALVEKYKIEIVPVQVTHEGRTFREYYDCLLYTSDAADD